MELKGLYRIPYKGLKCAGADCDGRYDFRFDIGDEAFRCVENCEVLSCRCTADISLLRAQNMLTLAISIEGQAGAACDRCLEECSVPIDFKGDLVVKISDEQGEYDGDVMWISPADDELDLTQYIYESIVLSLPYRRVHPEGECDPDMTARFRSVSAEELERIEARAEAADARGLDAGDKAKLAALKERMLDDEDKH